MKQTRTERFILHFILIVFGISFLYPLYWMITLSLKNKLEAGGNPLTLPSGFRFENYVDAWNRIDFPKTMLNSVIYTLGACVLCLALASLVSYALTRMQLRHAEGWRLYFTMGMVVPVAVLMIPIYRLILEMHLKNTYWALILPYAAFNMASSVLMLSAFFRTIPTELEEAAAIDGCTVTRTFFQIMAPQIKPALFTQLTLIFIFVWNEFPLASVVALREEWRTITVSLFSFFGTMTIPHWGVVGAAVTISTLPVLIVYLFGAKKIEGAMCVSSGMK